MASCSRRSSASWGGSRPRCSAGSSSGGTPAIFLVPLAVLGFLLCVLYRRTGSVIPGMGVHAFNNALTLGVGLSWSAAGVVAALIVAPIIVMTIVVPLSRD